MFGDKISRLASILKVDLSLPKLLGHESVDKEEEGNKEDPKIVKKSVSVIDSIIGFIFKIDRDNDNAALKASWGPLLIGIIVVTGFFGFFGIWAAIAPLDGAVIAVGEVSSSLNRQIVQHLEGGIIKEILVHEGDHVQKGQPLVLLNDAAALSNLSVIKERMLVLLATEARLLAMKNNSEEIEFPSQVYQLSDQSVTDKVLSNQRELFHSHTKSILGQIQVLKQRTGQLEQELSGLSAQLASEEKQHRIISEELETKRSLLDDGYISKPYILNLERMHADSEGKIGHLQAAISTVQQRIGENKLEIINIMNNVLDKINAELKETDAGITDLKVRLKAAEDVLKRTVIRSPQNGIVTGLVYHTEGGVIPPGGSIMEIVPVDDDLVIEAKMPTRNIEEVLSAQAAAENTVQSGNHTGLRAKVRLSAYNTRKFGLIDGIVTQVSANALSDGHGMKYYSLIVVIPKSSLAGRFENVKLHHGMPAEVFVVTRSRTLLNYLLTPITSTFEKAFKER